MGADQIAAIRPCLVELVQAKEKNEPGAANLCATFTIPDRPEVWAQVLLGTVNVFYPRTDEPLAFLRSSGIPPLTGLAVVSWKAGIYATFAHEPESLLSTARFVDRLLVALHALHPDDYAIDSLFEQIAT